jgi:hypothetical protein
MAEIMAISFCELHMVVIKIDHAVGLGPQANASGDRLRQSVLKVQFPIQIPFDILALNDKF